MKKYSAPILMLAIFETVAVTLWLTKDNIFYLFNFSYIGCSIALGMFLYIRKNDHARRIVQLLVGLYMLIYLGLICGENMQIEGFWYYLFTGTFEAATIHYAVAKIFGPLIFGRGWCGYACWTAMVLDFLPYKVPDKTSVRSPEKSLERLPEKTPAQLRKKLGWIRYVRSRDRARICLQRQPRLLQIHLPHNGLPETHEPFRRDACEMRRRKVRIMRKV